MWACALTHYFFEKMARGKLGGTKAAIRGKVGNEIYQLKRDDSGSLVQSVYKAPETRAYSNTEAQARARMIMGQIERMFNALPDIIKYAFKTIPDGTLSFQNFSRINYGLLKQDATEHWQADTMFDWRPKFDVTAPAGIWQLTDGVLPPFKWGTALFSRGINNSLELSWQSPNDDPTIGDFFAACGMQKGDKLKVLFYMKKLSTTKPSIQVLNCRLNPEYTVNTRLSNTLSDQVLLQASQWDLLVEYDVARNLMVMEISGNNFSYDYQAACAAFIILRESKKGNSFSSSEFRWLLDTREYGYQRNTPEQVFNTWLEL